MTRRIAFGSTRCSAAGRKTARRSSAARLAPKSACGTSRAVGVDRLEHRAHARALLGAEFRVPDLEEQNHPRLARAVPGLVLHGVVEHPGLALDDLARVVADAQAAILRHDQRQVAD